MIRPSQLAFAAGLSVIALTAVGVARLQALQRVGTPGIKLIDQAVFMEDGTRIGTQTVPLPMVVLDYQSHEEPIGKKVVTWLPKDTTYAQRIYEAPDHFRIQANVVLMGTDRTSIHKPEYCLPAQGFQT